MDYNQDILNGENSGFDNKKVSENFEKITKLMQGIDDTTFSNLQTVVNTATSGIKTLDTAIVGLQTSIKNLDEQIKVINDSEERRLKKLEEESKNPTRPLTKTEQSELDKLNEERKTRVLTPDEQRRFRELDKVREKSAPENDNPFVSLPKNSTFANVSNTNTSLIPSPKIVNDTLDRSTPKMYDPKSSNRNTANDVRKVFLLALVSPSTKCASRTFWRITKKSRKRVSSSFKNFSSHD
jgi:hypothetical protein